MRYSFARSWSAPISALTAALLLGVCAAAQTSGSISGVVLDPAGKPVSGARIEMTTADERSPLARATTSRTGTFAFPLLPPAVYALSVESAGFQNLTLDNIRVYPATETPLRIRLMQAGSNGVADSTSGIPAPASVPISATVTREQAANLPLAHWEAAGLLELVPGVQRNGRAPLSVYGESTSLGSVAYQGVDVLKNLQRSNPAQFALPAVSAVLVDEVFVVAGDITGCGCARIGFTAPRPSAARHGSAYALLDPSTTAAQFWSDNARNTPSRRRAYDFGADLGEAFTRTLSYYAGVEGALDRSTITRTGAALTRPLASRDPLMQQVLRLIPVDPSGAYRGEQRNGTSHLNLLGRLDYAPSSRHRAGLAVLASNTALDDPEDSSLYGSAPTTRFKLASRTLSASWRWTPGANLTNELRAGGAFSRFSVENALRSDFGFIAILRDPRFALGQPMEGLDLLRRNADLYSLEDDLNWFSGRHSASLGFSFQQHRLRSEGAGQTALDSGSVPRYVISDIPAGSVSRVSRRFNLASAASGYLSGTPASAILATKMLSGYLSDAWRPYNPLILSLGVRFDWLGPAEVERGAAIIPVLSPKPSDAVYDKNLPFIFATRDFYRNDLTNYAIYVGLGWKPARELPLVIRGSAHLSSLNDNLLGNMSFFALQNPFQNLDVSADLSASPAPLSSRPVTETPAAPPEWTLQSLMTLSRKYGHEPGAVYGINPQLATPNIKYWNIGVESQIKGFDLDVRYLGNLLEEGARSVDRNQVMTYRGDYLQRFKQVRYELQNGLPTAGFPQLQGGGLCLNRSLQNCQPDQYARSLILTGQAGELGRWYESQEYGVNVYNLLGNPVAPRGINILSHMGVSRFDGLQFRVSRNAGHGLSLQASYLFSKVMSNLDDYQPGAIDPFLDVNNSSQEWAPAPFDLKHALKASVVEDLPSFVDANSTTGKIVRNWTLAATLIAQSGAPFSILSGGYVTTPEGELTAVSGLGTMTSLADSGQNTVFTTLGGREIRGMLGVRKSADGTVSYIDAPASSFQQPEPGGLGNLQRRMLYGPAAIGVNLGLRRSIAFNERMRLQLRAEAINLLNRVNWLVRDQALLGSDAKTQRAVFSNDVHQWNSPRALQFSLRLVF